MKYLLIAVLSVMGLNAWAGNSGVKGKVIDAATKEPLEYASVALFLEQGEQLISGGITNREGVFSFDKLNAGNYYLEIQFVGYERKRSDRFSLKAGEQLKVGEIAIGAENVLVNEVAVTGEKINATNRLEKQTYRADQFESAKGGSAIDVLKNMPSVAVNGQGEITLRGSTGFLVLVNDKPVLADAQTILAQLPANSIQNVELITSPSAKYDPDGNAGIINITTKSGTNDHLGVVLNLQAGLPSTTTFDNQEKPVRYGSDLLLNYQKEKWTVVLGANYTRNDLAGYRVGDVYIDNVANQTQNHFPSEGERSFYRYNYAGQALVGFQADENNQLSVGVFAGKRYQERDANLFYTNSQTDLGTGNINYEVNYYNANKQIKEGTFIVSNLDYTHRFSKQSVITFSGLYEYDDLTGNTHNRNMNVPGGNMIQYVQNPYEKPIDGYRLQVDYALDVAGGKLEAGYQFRNDKQDGFFDYLITPEELDQPLLDQFRGTADSRNRINSLYTQFSAKRDKLEYSTGLRYEHYDREVELSTDPETHTLSLSNFFPSVNVLYKLDENWKVKAGYNRRIQRSSNNQLNPIPEREHSETLEIGDPDLRPELVNALELGVVNTFEKGSVFATLYFRGSKDPVQRVNSIYADTILNRVYTNVDKANAYGLEFGTNVKPVKWWNLYVGANVFKQEYKGDFMLLGEKYSVNNDGDWVYSINMNTNFDLTSTLALQANVNYLSKRPTAQGEDSRFLSPNLSLKKSFLNNRISASLQWQNIDLGMKESNRQRITTWGEEFYTTTNYIYETDMLLVNLTFNLNKKQVKSKALKSEFGENEF